ncbi:ATP-binding protein [Streptomyces antimicrobicus]|uniref:ATP-binding protein n=1 Tax=Streptomyces antimicrobicus TaxID=2883108 RepID=A0ABS8B7X3_9ACTN|nr:ATP-binding protein [Streptomyces antimicrobicus]MCB5180668.1 ATP-binding protein [Streptomyces antimicrobicus]
MTTSPGTLDQGRWGGTLPPGGQRRRIPLAGLSQPVSRARSFTVRALEDWRWSTTSPGVDHDAAHDVVLLVAELVANAVLHGGGPLALVLDASEARLRVEVSDGDPTLPRPRLPHQPSVPGGHGLLIVQQTSDRWGADRHAEGKTIWAEFDTTRLTPDP